MKVSYRIERCWESGVESKWEPVPMASYNAQARPAAERALASMRERMPEVEFRLVEVGQSVRVLDGMKAAGSEADGWRLVLLRVVGDVEPELVGEYETCRARLDAARACRAAEAGGPDGFVDGLYWLDVSPAGALMVGAFTGAELEVASA